MGKPCWKFGKFLGFTHLWATAMRMYGTPPPTAHADWSTRLPQNIWCALVSQTIHGEQQLLCKDVQHCCQMKVSYLTWRSLLQPRHPVLQIELFFGSVNRIQTREITSFPKKPADLRFGDCSWCTVFCEPMPFVCVCVWVMCCLLYTFYKSQRSDYCGSSGLLTEIWAFCQSCRQ